MTLRSTRSFRREQADLLGHVERLPVVAHELPFLSADERIEAVEGVVAFLVEVLLPHAEVAERTLYPGAGRLLGDSGEGGAVAHDRQELRARIAELAATDPGDAGALQEILYALHTLLSIHLQHEEEVYLRLVQSEPDESVRQLIRRVAEEWHDLPPAG
jgi:hemerythrin HHE cation binding domain-containing protein